jgi:ribonuclease P/MRP protein subunit POP1
MKEDNTPTVTARRRIPSAKQRLRLENAKRLKALNQHSKSVRQKKKEAKDKAAAKDPENHIANLRLPKIPKNNLSEPPTATSKFKKRQVHKTWLPTHLWHTKRAHMSKPSEPLWRMAIPISPTEKSYRPSHRASGGRGCITWDTSYMSTISCQGVEASLEGMLKAMGFHGEGWSGAKYQRWKKGTRFAQGWVFERDNKKEAVAPVTVIWCPHPPAMEKNVETPAAGDDREPDTEAVPADNLSKPIRRKQTQPSNFRLIIRIHPSAFHQFWLLLLKIAKMQRPQVTVEDLRFNIGSIEITGPGSTEALLGVLRPVDSDDSSESIPVNTWRSLAGLTNPASLPWNCLLAFDIYDPRLNHPPKQVEIPKDTESISALTELMVSWPPDHNVTPGKIFSHKARYVASKSLPSQKAINRRKALAPPGRPPNVKATDPRIPVLLLASRPPTGSTAAQGTWTVLLPWNCVDAVWRSLMYYPLSSGGTPRFGGLDQKRQICFERGEAFFPIDAAATEAGQAWERTESARRFDDWTRRPASRRVAWETIEIGNGRKGEHGRGWTCDWTYLLTGRSSEPAGTVDYEPDQEMEHAKSAGKRADKGKPKTQRQRKLAKATQEEQSSAGLTKASADSGQPVAGSPLTEVSGVLKSAAAPEVAMLNPENSINAIPSFVHLPPTIAIPLLENIQKASLPDVPSLVTIRITLLTRGTPLPCARIYRLPSLATPAGENLYKAWLALDPTTSPSKQADGRKTKAKARLKKDKVNHRGGQKIHTVHRFESLDHVIYTPPDAPAEYFKTPEHLKQVQAQAAALAAAQKWRTGSPPPEDRAALWQALMAPTKDTDGNPHPACPGVKDLIGFVTTGAYNLAEGRGMAIGSVWLQKVVEGSRRESCIPHAGGNDKRNQKQMERQRKLCIVRNAGETVGRLGVWEVCETC